MARDGWILAPIRAGDLAHVAVAPSLTRRCDL
jgi:hypothetical protein